MSSGVVVGVVVLAIAIIGITVLQVVMAGRLDGSDARSTFGRGQVPDSRPLATTQIMASESGPMLFGWDRVTMDVYVDAIVFRFRPTPLVVPVDRVSGLERHRGLAGSSWVFLGPSGERTSLQVLASRGDLRRTLSAGGVLRLVEAS